MLRKFKIRAETEGSLAPEELTIHLTRFTVLLTPQTQRYIYVAQSQIRLFSSSKANTG